MEPWQQQQAEKDPGLLFSLVFLEYGRSELSQTQAMCLIASEHMLSIAVHSVHSVYKHPAEGFTSGVHLHLDPGEGVRAQPPLSSAAQSQEVNSGSVWKPEDPGPEAAIDPLNLPGHSIGRSRALDESYNVLSGRSG